MIRIERLKLPLLAALFTCLAWACSGDEVDSGLDNGQDMGTSSERCAEDESYNPILDRCVAKAKPKEDMGKTPPRRDQGMTSSDQGDGLDLAGDMADEADLAGDMAPDMALDMAPGEDMIVEPDGGGTCGYGTILGVACVPSGDALPNALVTVTGIDCHTGQAFTMTTQASPTGRYELSGVPSGSIEVTLESGSFSRTFPVLLMTGGEVDLTNSASKGCIEGGAVKIAIIEGIFDDIEGILDELQIEHDPKGNDGQGVVDVGLFGQSVNDSAGLKRTRDFLMDPAAMAQYDIIFINCGILWQALNINHAGDVQTIINNLYDYYNSGRSLYASDWAYFFVERAFSGVIDFYPAGESNDVTFGNALKGYAPQIINADVVNPALQGVLGVNNVMIDFPQDTTSQNIQWAMMSSVTPNATIHLSGSAGVCAGSSGCSSQGSVEANIPLLVTFTSPTSSGSIAFTSFHNHPAGAPISPQISQILKYLIFQL